MPTTATEGRTYIPGQHLWNLDCTLLHLTDGYYQALRAVRPSAARGIPWMQEGEYTRHPFTRVCPVRGECAVQAKGWPNEHEEDVLIYTEDHPSTIKTDERSQWGWINHRGEFEHFNAGVYIQADGKASALKLFAKWHEFIQPQYRDPKPGEGSKRVLAYAGAKWICKPPGPVRFPCVYRLTTLCFELSPYQMPMEAFRAQLKKEDGVTISLSGDHLRHFFQQSQHVPTTSIVIAAIWIREVHSSFPEPLSVQLTTKHHSDPTKYTSSWFIPEGPGCDHIVYPGNNKKKEMVWIASPTIETPEFNRWVGVSRSDMEKQMRDALRVSERRGGTSSSKYMEYHIQGPNPDCVHPTNYLQFLALTEWSPRILEEANNLSPEQPELFAKVEGAEGRGYTMIVAQEILDPLVKSKFEAEQDRGRYLLRFDTGISLHLKLKNRLSSYPSPTSTDTPPSPPATVTFHMKVGLKWDPWIGID